MLRSYSMRFRPLVTALCVFLPLMVAAQSDRLEISAGGGWSAVQGRNTQSVHFPKAGAHVMLAYRIWLGKNVFIKTGLGYEQRQSRTRFDLVDDDSLRSGYDITYTYHFLSLPLQVGGMLWQQSRHPVTITGGLNYDFLLQAKQQIHIDRFNRAGAVYDTQDLDYKMPVFLAPPNNRVTNNSQGGTLLFNPATYLEVGYALFGHGTVKAFYEYLLNDIQVYASGTGSGRLHYAGIALGWSF